jgi:hypothetical protein
MSLRSIGIAQGGETKGSAEQSQLAVADLCDSTSEDVPSDPQKMSWYVNSIVIITAYC